MLPVVVPGASFELHDPATSVKLAAHQCIDRRIPDFLKSMFFVLFLDEFVRAACLTLELLR